MQAMTTQDKNGKTLRFINKKRVTEDVYHLANFAREKDTFFTIERKGKFYHYHNIRGI